MRPAAVGLFALISVAASMNCAATAGVADVLGEARAARQLFLENARRLGDTDPEPLAAVEQQLRAMLALPLPDTQRAEVLYELGTVLRLAFRFPEAIPELEEAAAAAEAAGRNDVAFDAWIGVSIAQDLNPGASLLALDKAEAAAAEPLTRQQRHKLAQDRASSLDRSGELEAALVAASDALSTAETSEERFQAHFTAGGIFVSFAERCDFEPRYEDCRRAVAAAANSFRYAASAAAEAGWTAFAEMAHSSAQGLAARLRIIEYWAADSVGYQNNKVFFPEDLSDVLVTELFGLGSGNYSTEELRSTLKKLVPDTSVKVPHYDPETPQKLLAEGDVLSFGGETEKAAANYAAAIDLVERQQSSLFDARRRGTVMEGSMGVYFSAATQLLKLGRQDEAFAAFESGRARGLAELSSLVEGGGVGASELEWLSKLLSIEAQISAAQDGLAQQAIKTEELLADEGALEGLRALQRARRELIESDPDAVRNLAASGGNVASLDELKSAAKSANIPVLLYWSDRTNVIAWYVGPHGSEVRLVFLPQSVLREKVQKLRGPLEESETSFFDRETARHLYLYLIAPFAELLEAERQLMIVPQGDLVSLPFELLVDPGNDRFLIERWAVSYAPNATMAARALTRQIAQPTRVAAIFDEEIEYQTQEMVQLQAALGPERVDAAPMQDLDEPALRQKLAAADSLHLLVHGTFKREPLLSRLDLGFGDREEGSLYAADLVGLPLSHMVLAVLSACESGQAERRISNEIFGIPWALLVAGVDQVVLSRWRVQAATNGVWMAHLYRALGAGASPANAAATSMRAMLAEPETTHPYFWAGPQVTGR